ncbi:hypothetical protein, partial [Micromonospora sp. RTP1Z1]|uniref:hypothetical protein n=1 Tax=Micromonospora sp. RTP1Z1 TaxID=2994043 RepID=UPI0029C93611
VLLGLAALLLPTALAGGLVASERLPQLTVRSMPRPHQMIAVGGPDGGMYGLTIEPKSSQGIHVSVGSSDPPLGRLVLRICATATCHQPVAVPLVDIPRTYSNWPGRQANEHWLTAVNSDGRMVATDLFGNQLVVVEP